MSLIIPARFEPFEEAGRATEHLRAHGLAAGVLRNAGGRDAARAQGEWRNGQWVDFDPVRPPMGAV